MRLKDILNETFPREQYSDPYRRRIYRHQLHFDLSFTPLRVIIQYVKHERRTGGKVKQVEIKTTRYNFLGPVAE